VRPILEASSGKIETFVPAPDATHHPGPILYLSCSLVNS